MTSQHNLIEISASLKRVPFLKPLSDEQLLLLANRVRVHSYPPGVRLILEGTYGHTAFIIDEGEVDIYKLRRNEKVLLARRGAGSIFGEMALIDSSLRTATVQTTTRSKIIEIKKPAFEALIAEYPPIANFVMQELNLRLRTTDSRMVEDLIAVNASLLAAQRRIEEVYDATLAALGSALDLRDTETEGHSRRVTEYSMAIGRAIELDPPMMKALRRGGLLHDIGKIGVPDAILLKPGRLSAQEWVLMKQHPTWGAKIVQDIEFLRDAIPVVRHHHEWWNGRGYPDGLKGEEIPLVARIFAIADTFDALTSERPYRRALEPREALEIMRRESGTHLDPQIFKIFEVIFRAIIDPMCRAFHQ
ncbi:MAG: HD-GYP domain-containing protein [Ardenticatenaceae bacterium]